MKIVIDDKIPYIREAVARITPDAVYLKGAAITAADVRDADALIVRTRTICNEQLLRDSRVSFVGTATIGFDHIDTEYMERAGVAWTNCPGCNSGSVAQYLHSVLLLLARDFSLPLRMSTIGIVGCGHVGSKVKRVAESLGMRVLVCDPPLEKEYNTHRSSPDIHRQSSPFSTMAEIEREADVITFHVPLERGGDHPTFHIGDEAFFQRLRKRPFIINSSRGAVVDNRALLAALEQGLVRQAVVDTWEGEPEIDTTLLNRVYIGTPHIAGYSADGKTNANNMVLKALCRHFDIDCPPEIVPPTLPDGSVYGRRENSGLPSPTTSDDIAPLRFYNPLVDSERLKAHPEDFERLRGDYPLRREANPVY